MKTNCSPWLYVSGLAFEPWIAFLIGLQMMWKSKEDNLKKKKKKKKTKQKKIFFYK